MVENLHQVLRLQALSTSFAGLEMQPSAGSAYANSEEADSSENVTATI